MRTSVAVAAVLSVLGAGLWTAPPATGVVGPLALRVTPSGGPSGARVVVTGGDAAPGAPVRLELQDGDGRVTALPETVADAAGDFRASFLLPEREPSRLLVVGCAYRGEQPEAGCQREGRAPLAHHGSPAVRGEPGHRRTTLRLERFADPASCGPVVVRRAGEPGVPVDLRQARDGTWSGGLDLAAPPGRWTVEATQASEGCDVRASTSSASWGLATDPQEPRVEEPVRVLGRAFEDGCPALEVALAGQRLGSARPDEDGAFTVPATAPSAPGAYALTAARPASERCPPVRLTETVQVLPAVRSSPTDPPVTTAPPTTSPPAAADVPSLAVDTAREGVLLVTGSRWAPDEDVVLRVDGAPAGRVPAGPDGSLETTLLAPEDGGQHLLAACQRCEAPVPLLATAAFDLPGPSGGPHPALALVLLVPAAALPAHRHRQRRLARRASVAGRPGPLLPRLRPLSGPPGRSVRLVPRSAPADARLRRGPP